MYVAIAEHPQQDQSPSQLGKSVASALLTSRLTTRQVYFLRIEFSGWNLDSGPLTVYGAALDFSGQELPGAPAGERTIVELLDYAFFDDDTTVLLVRAEGEFDKHVAPTPLLT